MNGRSLAIVQGVLDNSLRPRLPPSLLPGAPELTLMQKMWDADPEKRPNFTDIVITWEAIRALDVTQMPSPNV
jgi:hypothetical protein